MFLISKGSADDYKAKNVPDKRNIGSKNGEDKGKINLCFSDNISVEQHFLNSALIEFSNKDIKHNYYTSDSLSKI